MVKKKQPKATILKPRFQPAPAPNFTQEQSILSNLFGGGESAIMPGDGESLPRINNALSPGRNGDQDTSSLFGFGYKSERSGLF